MIERLKIWNKIDVYDFLERVDDKFQDFYLTEDKSRKFLKKDWSLIERVLLKQEIYAIKEKEVKGILFIYRSKGFRPYVKLLAENTKFAIDLLKFLKWNFSEQQLFFKIKKENPLSQMIFKTGFNKIGDRGTELLFEKKAIKEIYKFTPKDEYLPKEKNRLY